VTPLTFLGVALIALAAAGLVAGLVAVVPGRSAGELALGGLAAVAGAGICLAVLRWGRRGLQPWQRWFVFVLLFAALGIGRLPRVWQLVLVAAGAGYFAAFVFVLGRRIIRVTRPR
jgi:hypothetical protein